MRETYSNGYTYKPHPIFEFLQHTPVVQSLYFLIFFIICLILFYSGFAIHPLW